MEFINTTNDNEWQLLCAGEDKTNDKRFDFYVRNTYKYVMTLVENGNVGIGTTSPTHALSVNGAANFSTTGTS